MADEVIYFISDTHLGDGTGADRFQFPKQLNALLDRIDADPNAELVLLGDFMELWATSMEAVLIHYAPIFSKIVAIAAKHSVTYVVGNHDCVPWYYFVGEGIGNIRVAEQYTGARGALIAVHGHQYDPTNQVKVLAEGNVKVPWTRKLVQVVGFLERVGGDKAGDFFANMADVLSNAGAKLEQLMPDQDDAARRSTGAFLQRAKAIFEHQSPGERGYPQGERIYEEAANNLMRGGARYVVMGHTHHPLTRRYGNRMYVNSGSWVWDRYPPTYARFANGQLELLNGETHQPFEPPAGGANASPSGDVPST